jgi:hypothetical protein
MSLSLPSKTAKPTPENVRTLEAALTSAIAGHPQSIEPWTFYEELDQGDVQGQISIFNIILPFN